MTRFLLIYGILMMMYQGQTCFGTRGLLNISYHNKGEGKT